MYIDVRRAGFGVTALALLLSACAHPIEPKRLYEPGAAASGAAAVLWSVGSRSEPYQERANRAVVGKIGDTKIKGNNPPRPEPIELLAGRYAVEIRLEKEWLYPELGLVSMERYKGSVELVIESGHSYSPQATRRCGKDWIWVEDWGTRVQNDIELWRKNGYYNYDFQEASGTKRVVAGEAPPDTCGDKQI
jgi:hypothetical protein